MGIRIDRKYLDTLNSLSYKYTNIRSFVDVVQCMIVYYEDKTAFWLESFCATASVGIQKYTSQILLKVLHPGKHVYVVTDTYAMFALAIPVKNGLQATDGLSANVIKLYS